MRVIVLIVTLAVLTGGAAAGQPRCGAGTWPGGGGCVPVDVAFIAPGGTTYWVDQGNARASDDNPGTRSRPWRTISRATGAGVLQPGDAVVVRGGVYRESILPHAGGRSADRRVAYVAYPGETVVVTGADPLVGGWRRDGEAWRHAWTVSLPAYGVGVFRRELVVVDGHVLRPVFDRSDLVPGTFFVEGPGDAPLALLVRLPSDDAPAAHHVEAATRHPLFWPLGANPYAACGDPSQPGWFHVVGFVFRHAANRAQWGAVCSGSAGSLFEQNTVEWTNGLGFESGGHDHVFRNDRALDNGQMGFGGSCDGCLFEGNESSRNNWKGYDPYWEAGGGKWTHTSHTVFRRHVARDNEGPGLWLDIDNSDNVIEQSRMEGNAVAGIMLEMNTVRTTVRNDVVTGTRRRSWAGSGILSQAASHNVILHNTIFGNEGTGLWIRTDPDGRAPDGYNRIYNNLVVGNARAATGDAREIAIQGMTLVHARTNVLDGNRYGDHPSSMRRSTFYFAPDPERPAGFRSNDVDAWRTLTQGDGDAGLVTLDALQTIRGIPASAATGAALPGGLAVPVDFFGAMRPSSGASVGAVEVR